MASGSNWRAAMKDCLSLWNERCFVNLFLVNFEAQITWNVVTNCLLNVSLGSILILLRQTCENHCHLKIKSWKFWVYQQNWNFLRSLDYSCTKRLCNVSLVASAPCSFDRRHMLISSKLLDQLAMSTRTAPKNNTSELVLSRISRLHALSLRWAFESSLWGSWKRSAVGGSLGNTRILA